MAVVKIKQFLQNIKDPAAKRALYAILSQIQIEMVRGQMLGPAPGLVAKATADADLKTVAATYYAKSDGTIGTVAITATIDVSTIAGYTPTILAAGYARIFLLTITDAGTWGMHEGVTVISSATPVRPPTPAGKIAFGQIKVVNTTNPFTFGTTNSDAAGVTWTCSDMREIPSTVLA
jgi:hypothetical protein